MAEGIRRERERRHTSTPQTVPIAPPLDSPSSSGQLTALVEAPTASGTIVGAATEPLGDDPPPERPALPVHRPFPLKLPANHNSSARALYYGYIVTDETMYQYLLPRAGTHIDQDELSTMHITDATVLCLQRESGIRTPLHFKTALVDDTNRDLPRWENPPRIPIITVTSSYSLEFDRRPTQEQMDKLTTLLGTTPRWWLESWFKEETA